MDEEELMGLSDEERAALEEEEQEEVEATEDDEAPPVDEVDDSDDGDEPEADDPAGDTDDDAKPDNDEEEEEDEDEEEAQANEPPRDFVPQYKFDGPENYEETVSALREKQDELDSKYQEGELEWEDYRAQSRETDNELRQLEMEKLKAEMAEEQNRQLNQQLWEREQQRFLSREENQVYVKDPFIAAAFDAALKTLAADQANEDKDFAWFLDEADRQIRERFSALSPQHGSQQEKAKPKGKLRKASREKVPPVNLGDLPPAEVPEAADGGEFAHLDKLDGMELEKALARMTPEQQERYLRG